MKISTIVNFCTNDYRFLEKTIEQLTIFSSEIIIPICDHFFDGSKENIQLLNFIYQRFPQVCFIQFPFHKNKLFSPFHKTKPTDDSWRALWHSTSRYIGFLYSNIQSDFVFFLDADEIVEGKKMLLWLKKHKSLDQDGYWFSSYCYGFSSDKRAPHTQQTGLLIRKSVLNASQIFHSQERFGIYSQINDNKTFDVLGIDNKPMIHHYSWVRTFEEYNKKTMTWGKQHLCNWEQWFVDKKQEFLQYKTVEKFFDPLLVKIPSFDTLPSNVQTVTAKDTFRKETDAIF